MDFPTTFENNITVVDIKNPRWSDREKIRIDADVTFILPTDPENEVTMPFTSCPFDTFGPHCSAIFEHCASMKVGEWVRPEVTVEDLQADFDRIWPDVMLGLADDATIELAKNLRVQIKAMS